MPRGKPISVEKRSAVITLHQEGYSVRQIGEKVHLAKSSVDNIIKRYRTTESLDDRDRPGPSRMTTNVDDQRIVLISKRNRRLTAPQIAAEFNRDRPNAVSVSTIKRRLREANLFGRIAVRKPLLRRANRIKRLQWAKQHQHWTVEDWKNVLWTDESKFEVFGQNRRFYVRRSKTEKLRPECLAPTVKHGGGSVMVWGCFSYAGVGDLVQIEGIMRKEQYRNILEQNAAPSGRRLIGDNFTFMQDNDPKHTALLCRNYLNALKTNNILQIMSWPAQSPDLNPIELLWDELDRQVRKVAPTTKQHLWDILQQQWNSLPANTLIKLIERMPRIVRAVLKAKGGFFDEKKV